jgi:hypothetical protein
VSRGRRHDHKRRIVDGVAKTTDAGHGQGGRLRLAFEAPGVADLIAEVLAGYRSCSADGDVSRARLTAFPESTTDGGEVTTTGTIPALSA